LLEKAIDSLKSRQKSPEAATLRMTNLRSNYSQV
jgi:hypothetical protein